MVISGDKLSPKMVFKSYFIDRLIMLNNCIFDCIASLYKMRET